MADLIKFTSGVNTNFSTELNENFNFNFVSSNANSSYLCKFMDSGDLSTSSINNLIFNPAITGVPNNTSITWSSLVPNFDSLVMVNRNTNKVNDGIVEIAYLNGVGDLIAGRVNLLTSTFTQTHTVLAADLPVATAIGLYDQFQYSMGTYAVLSDNDELTYGTFSNFEQIDSPENRAAIIVNSKQYDTSGATIATDDSLVVQATTGDQHNRVYIQGKSPGYYISGSVCKTMALAMASERDTDRERQEYHNIYITTGAGSISVSGSLIRSVSDNDGADVSTRAITTIDDRTYIKYQGDSDDGGSVNEETNYHYVYQYDLSNFSPTIIYSNSDGSSEGGNFVVTSNLDIVYIYSTIWENDGDEQGGIRLYVDNVQTFSYDSSVVDDLASSFTIQTMPKGVEYSLEITLDHSGSPISTEYKAMNRIDNTEAAITRLSTVSCPDANYVFEETDGTRHIASLSGTDYILFGTSSGEVNFEDTVTPTDVGNIFVYYEPFINDFWTEFKQGINTGATLSSGSGSTSLNGRQWQQYSDSVEGISLTLTYDSAPLQGTGDLGYYMLYTKQEE